MNAVLVLLAATLVRNPFWPIGFEGAREEISADARVIAPAPAPEPPPKPAAEPPKPAAEPAKPAPPAPPRPAPVGDGDWAEARRTLKFGGIVFARQPDGTTRSSIDVNGRDCSDGDLVSTVWKSRRFTWRISGLSATGTTLKLERVGVQPVKTGFLKGAWK